jgi:hypothetical protein
VGRAPLQDTSVQWLFRGEAGPAAGLVLNGDVARGGVRIQTWRLDHDTLLSNLTLHRAGSRDEGNYSCSLPGGLAELGQHTVRVHILDHEQPVAVHSGSARLAASLPLLLCRLAGWWQGVAGGRHKPLARMAT